MKINQKILKEVEKLFALKEYAVIISKFILYEFDKKNMNKIVNSNFNKLMGASLVALGRKREALERYELAEIFNENDAEIKSNIAGILFEFNEKIKSENYYNKALIIQPKNPNILFNKSLLLQNLNRDNEAIELYDQVIRLSPNFIFAINNKAALLEKLGKIDLAEIEYKKALNIDPKNIEVLNNLGSLNRRRSPYEAMKYYDEGLKVDAENIILHYNKANLLQDIGDYEKAMLSYKKCINSGMNNSGLYVGLATIYQNLGEHDLAFENYKKALELEPLNEKILSGLIFGISHNSKISTAEIVYYNSMYNNLLENKFDKEINKINKSIKNKSKLKVGLISADFWNHAIVFFLPKILEALSNYDDIELYGYYNNSIIDSETVRFMSYFKAWRSVDQLSDIEVKNMILKDDIDILIDMSGHTSGERLAVFAMKAAPIQMSFMGYPGSTGLSSMDYFLITEAFFPEQSCVELFTETIVKLPYQHFEPLASLPKIKELPALNNGFTTFASFNRANKISRECVNLWARILKNSNSKMIVGGLMQNSKDNNNIKKWFAEEGIKEDVVEYYSIMPLNELMILLNNKVDICLDSFPYGGGTTSWLAISMGVPTISLEGESPASKVGASILRSMGLKNYIANDQAEYYLIATTVINEIKKLNEIRLKMRSRFYKSNSSKPKLSAASLIYLFKKTWEIYNTKSSKIFVIDTQSVKNIYKINNYKRLMYLQYKNGNFEECLKTADKIIKLDKNNLAAIKLKGTLCLHKGEIERGIILFESISDELDEEAVNNLAVGYQKVGSSEKAKELLKKYIITNSNYLKIIKLYINLINLEDMDLNGLSENLSLIHNYELFELLYKKLYDFDCTRSDYYADLIFKQAENFEFLSDLDYWRHFQLFIRRFNFEAAIECMKKINKRSIYSKLALLKLKLITNDDVGVEELYANILAENNFDIDCGIILIDYYVHKKNYNLALTIADKYAEKIDQNFKIIIKKAEIYMQLNKYNEALKELLILINLRKSSIVFEKIAYIFNKLNFQDKANTYIDMAISINKYKESSWKLKLHILKSGNENVMTKKYENYIDYLSTNPLQN